MFVCSMCKTQFESEPAMVNGSPERRNKFCADCKQEIADRMGEAQAARNEPGICMWCGEAFSPTDATDHVCPGCCRNRDWLLKCGRNSDTAVRYVLNRSEKWAAYRKDQAKKAAQKIPITSVIRELDPTGVSVRLDKLELMLGKLLKSLGE